MTTKTRSTFLDRLAQVDAILKTERQPIDATALNEAARTARLGWPQWSANRRPAGREDAQATLEAEIAHARADFLRLVARHNALALFDPSDQRNDPAEYYRLPRERAAAAALNALTHAGVQTRLVSEQIGRLRKQLPECFDQSQSAHYRLNWGNVYRTSRTDLETLIKRRRRDWQRFLQLLAEYREIAR